MSQVRLAVVGCGGIAQYTALFARLSRRIRLAAACDIHPERAASFARRFSIPKACTDYNGVLGDGIDAVYLATPHHLHHEMIAAAIQAGKAVLVEKPITRTLTEGLEIARLAEASGVKAAVNYQYRYDPGCYALARAVQRGDLGEIHSMRMNVPWRRGPDYFSGAPWHAQQSAAGGGTLLTQGSHILDIALWAVEGEPDQTGGIRSRSGAVPTAACGLTARRKFKDVEVEDLAHGIIELSSGALLQISSTMTAAREKPVTLEVYGDRATAYYSSGAPFASGALSSVRFTGARVSPERMPAWGVHPLQRSLDAFAAWVQGGPPHLVPPRAALPVLAVVEAVYESAHSGCKTAVRHGWI